MSATQSGYDFGMLCDTAVVRILGVGNVPALLRDAGEEAEREKQHHAKRPLDRSRRQQLPHGYSFDRFFQARTSASQSSP